jgi:hypothetical protein
MRRLVASLFTALLTLALLAPMALAHDNGQGTYGETNDKVVTNAGFLVIAFIPLFISFMSFVQWRLEKRKDRRKASLPSRDWSGGW